MTGPHRRDVLRLAAAPLAGWMAGAAQAPQAAAPPAVPPALKNEKEAAEAAIEIPAGTIEPLGSGPFQGMRWRIRYYFDELGKRCHVQDFAMPLPEFGLASMLVEDSESGSLKPFLLTTHDNGKTWKEQKTEKNPLGVFVLDADHAWVITGEHILATLDGGVKWEKRPLPDADSTQIWFSTLQTGWAYGGGRVFYRTEDGGKSWTAVPESEKLDIKSPETYLRSMALLPSGMGMLVGDSTSAVQPAGLPDWMTPDRAVRRKNLPGTAILFETHDHGQTWQGHAGSAFGAVRRVRMGGRHATAVFQYKDSFYWPSEVYEIGLGTGKSRPIFRRRDLVVHDVALLEDGGMIVAAIQPAGRLRLETPIPGRLRIFWTPDVEAWFEMKVDYRAVGNEVTLARNSDGSLWAATDEGAILQLAQS